MGENNQNTSQEAFNAAAALFAAIAALVAILHPQSQRMDQLESAISLLRAEIAQYNARYVIIERELAALAERSELVPLSSLSRVPSELDRISGKLDVVVNTLGSNVNIK